MSTWVLSPISLSTSTYCVKGSFILYFGVVKRAIIAAWLSQFTTTFLILISANIMWDAGFPLQNFSLKHSRIIAKMNGFFGNVIMTVVDKHTCSSPVVIKLGAFCVAVDVVVNRLNFFIVFLC